MLLLSQIPLHSTMGLGGVFVIAIFSSVESWRRMCPDRRRELNHFSCPLSSGRIETRHPVNGSRKRRKETQVQGLNAVVSNRAHGCPSSSGPLRGNPTRGVLRRRLSGRARRDWSLKAISETRDLRCGNHHRGAGVAFGLDWKSTWNLTPRPIWSNDCRPERWAEE